MQTPYPAASSSFGITPLCISAAIRYNSFNPKWEGGKGFGSDRFLLGEVYHQTREGQSAKALHRENDTVVEKEIKKANISLKEERGTREEAYGNQQCNDIGRIDPFTAA
jgi:hypothetical protein